MLSPNWDAPQMEVFQRDLAPINITKAALREKFQELSIEAERLGMSKDELRDLISS